MTGAGAADVLSPRLLMPLKKGMRSPVKGPSFNKIYRPIAGKMGFLPEVNADSAARLDQSDSTLAVVSLD